MYFVKNITCYRVIDLFTGEHTKWFCNKQDIYGYALQMIRKRGVALLYDPLLADSDRVGVRIAETGRLESWTLKMPGTDGEVFTVKRHRFIAVENNLGEYLGAEEVVKSRKAHVSKHKYRKEPVPSTGRRQYYCDMRNIRYKNTLVEAYDGDNESGCRVSPVRKRTMVNKWDLEPMRVRSRSWKDQSRKAKQWM